MKRLLLALTLFPMLCCCNSTNTPYLNELKTKIHNQLSQDKYVLQTEKYNYLGCNSYNDHYEGVLTEYWYNVEMIYYRENQTYSTFTHSHRDWRIVVNGTTIKNIY